MFLMMCLQRLHVPSFCLLPLLYSSSLWLGRIKPLAAPHFPLCLPAAGKKREKTMTVRASITIINAQVVGLVSLVQVQGVRRPLSFFLSSPTPCTVYVYTRRGIEIYRALLLSRAATSNIKHGQPANPTQPNQRAGMRKVCCACACSGSAGRAGGKQTGRANPWLPACLAFSLTPCCVLPLPPLCTEYCRSVSLYFSSLSQALGSTARTTL